jgi:hypothetical protein
MKLRTKIVAVIGKIAKKPLKNIDFIVEKKESFFM